MSLAVLCSGQGGQHRDMFALTGTAADAAPVFEAARAEFGGIDPRRFVREASGEALFGNRAGQILCCTQALAAWAAIGLREMRPVIAGYSVGELAAWGCAGLFGTGQCLRLAGERAAIMDRVAPAGAGLAAVTGLRRDALERLLDGRASVAIVNGADSFVIGGNGAALDRCVDEAVRYGARARRLRVAVPSHTPLLDAAAAEFAVVLDREATPASHPSGRLLSGIDGGTVHDARSGVGGLTRQIRTTIDWAASLDACREAGATIFLELGPGGALARMAGANARSLDDFRSIAGVRDWLARSV